MNFPSQSELLVFCGIKSIEGHNTACPFVLQCQQYKVPLTTPRSSPTSSSPPFFPMINEHDIELNLQQGELQRLKLLKVYSRMMEPRPLGPQSRVPA